MGSILNGGLGGSILSSFGGPLRCQLFVRGIVDHFIAHSDEHDLKEILGPKSGRARVTVWWALTIAKTSLLDDGLMRDDLRVKRGPVASAPGPFALPLVVHNNGVADSRSLFGRSS